MSKIKVNDFQVEALTEKEIDFMQTQLKLQGDFHYYLQKFGEKHGITAIEISRLMCTELGVFISGLLELYNKESNQTRN